MLAGRTLTGGPGVFGLITAAFGIGALIGALFSASMARASWTALALGSLGFGAAQLLLAPLHSVLGACLLLCATGPCSPCGRRTRTRRSSWRRRPSCAGA